LPWFRFSIHRIKQTNTVHFFLLARSLSFDGIEEIYSLFTSFFLIASFFFPAQ